MTRGLLRMTAGCALVGAALIAGCASGSAQAPPVAAVPRQPVARSAVVSVSASPEAVVAAFLDAANRGDGDAMNALFGPEPSQLYATGIDGRQAMNAVIIHPSTSTTEPLPRADGGFAVGGSAASAHSPIDRVQVSADVSIVGQNGYFPLEAGPAALLFNLMRDGDRSWYIASFGGRGR